jgi:drug/metabolite transporter (DMT)-like permease
MPGSRAVLDPGMLLVSLIWGVNFAIVKTTFTQIPPLPFAALRFLIASVVISLILWWREGFAPLPPGTWRRMIWLGLLGNSAYQILFVLGLSRTTTANSSLLVSTTPVLVALFAGLLKIERITGRIAGGIALAMSGIILVLLARGVSFSLGTLAGDLITLGSALCWAIYVLGVRTVNGNLSSLQMTTLTMLIGTPGLLLFGGPQMINLEWGSLTAASWFGVLFSSFFSITLCYLLYNRAVRRIGSVQATIYSSIIPVIATLTAWPMLGERPTISQGIGAVLIISGVLLTRYKAEEPAQVATRLDPNPSIEH